MEEELTEMGDLEDVFTRFRARSAGYVEADLYLTSDLT